MIADVGLPFKSNRNRQLHLGKSTHDCLNVVKNTEFDSSDVRIFYAFLIFLFVRVLDVSPSPVFDSIVFTEDSTTRYFQSSASYACETFLSS